MSIEARPRRALTPYRLNVRQFSAMIDAGILADNARVELIDGKLVRRMTKNPPHGFCVETLHELLGGLVGEGHFLRQEQAVQIGPRNCVEPDLCVVRGTRGDFRLRWPGGADVALVIEVADSTYAKDSGRMLRLYASAGIPVYWIVRIPERRVEVYSAPSGTTYETRAGFDESSVVPVILDGVERGRLPVQSFLP